MDPSSLPSVGAPGPLLEKTKPRPAWGRGGKERLEAQATPPPIQVLMSSSRDLRGCGENWEAGGRSGYQPTWCLGRSHTANLRPPGRPLSPQRLGLWSPGQSVTPAGTNCLRTSVSLFAASSCRRAREGVPQSLHTRARQPVGWGEPSPPNSQLSRSQEGLSHLFSHLQALGHCPHNTCGCRQAPCSQVTDGEQNTYRISPVAAFLTECTRWSWDWHLRLCDPKS